MFYRNAADVIEFGRQCKRWFAPLRDRIGEYVLLPKDIHRLKDIRHRFVYNAEFEQADRLFCEKVALEYEAGLMTRQKLIDQMSAAVDVVRSMAAGPDPNGYRFAPPVDVVFKTTENE